MVLVAIKGNLGAGKTIYMVREGFHYLQKGYNVYTNFHVDYSHKRLTDPKELIYIGMTDPDTPKVVLLDEAYLWFDSLVKSSKIQQFYRNLINITRKLNYIVFFTTQTLGQINLRTRVLFDFVVEPHYIKVSSKLRKKGRKNFMEVFIYAQNDYGGFTLGKHFKIPNIEKYHRFYDTDEIINDFIIGMDLSEYEEQKQQTVLPC